LHNANAAWTPGIKRNTGSPGGNSFLFDMRKKRLKPFRATKAVKSLARDVIGTPPATRALPDEKKQKRARQKHKSTLAKLLTDGE
jgi:hypothetical protein